MPAPWGSRMADITWLVDGPGLFFRAYFASPGRFRDERGEPVDGAAGFARALAAILASENVSQIGVGFDFSLGTGFRHALFPGYKQRRPMPDDNIRYQFELCLGWCRALGVAALGSQVFEADDILASWAAQARLAGRAVMVHSADKDLAQLVINEHDRWWPVGREQRLDRGAIEAEWGLAPARLAELLALTGDSSDDIPGVPGVGRISAARLLGPVSDLEALHAALSRGEWPAMRSAERLGRLVLAHWPQVQLAHQLTHLREDVAEAWSTPLAWSPPRRDGVQAWLEAQGLERAFAGAMKPLSRVL